MTKKIYSVKSDIKFSIYDKKNNCRKNWGSLDDLKIFNLDAPEYYLRWIRQICGAAL